jgi:DNA polymerase I
VGRLIKQIRKKREINSKNSMPQPKKLFLLDAMALIYRAYFALNKNPRINSKGLNTSAILGFANTLFEILKNEKPTHIAVCFDMAAPTVRHDDFSGYKAHREAMPEDLSKSLPYIHELIEAFNIPVYGIEGYEADDIIGTLAKKAEQQGFETYMMTSDKDFGQLVSEHIFMYKPGRMGDKAQKLGVPEICKRFGIKRPEQVIDILGLWGDVSDNIPGIPGIGEVTARKLLEEFDTVENLIQNADSIKNPRLKEKVIEYAEQALFSKQLATIILDVPVDLVPDQVAVKPPDEKRMHALFDELEFRNFAKRVFTELSLRHYEEGAENGNTPNNQNGASLFPEDEEETPAEKKTIHTVRHNYMVADTPELRKTLIDHIIQTGFVCFDTETTGLDTSNTELVAMSFSLKPHEAWFVPVPQNYNEALQLVAEFKPVFENESISKIGQNMKFDMAVLKWYDISVNGKLFDTMIAHYLLQPDMRHGMDFLAESYLNYKPIPIEQVIGPKGKSQLTMNLIPADDIKDYAAEDADITLQLKNLFEPVLTETNTRKLFDEIEMPLVPVLAAIEAEGVKIDTLALKEAAGQLQTEIAVLTSEIHNLAGIEFNIASPKQLGEVLFDKMNIVENAKLTKTKQYSTGEEILIKLVSKHPIIQKILDYRSLTKLKSTYVDALPLMVNQRTGRIHTSYNQAVAATGRLSSNNPNLQNIPVRTERGREIRKAFVPRNEKYILLSADYSQIELRIIAELSGDQGMKDDFIAGHDIHAATASKVYGVELNAVTRDQRRNAKTVNFGIVYGISAFGLADRLGIPRKEAAVMIDQYFIKYPLIKEYMDKTIADARKNGFVETIMGRRRYVNDINSSNAAVRGYAERNAINAPIQGSAADMIKIAMIRIYNEFEQLNLKSKMIMQVHDELVFDVLRTEEETVKKIVRENMVNAIKLSIPVEVEMSVGENWLEAH